VDVARIYRVPDGRYGRLTLELPVEPAPWLLELQARLGMDYPGFDRQLADNLHVTVVHLGRPQDLLAEVRAWQMDQRGPDLLEFFHGLERLMTGWLARPLRWSGSMRALDLRWFGTLETPLAGVALWRHPVLTRWHTTAWAELMAFLESQGIREPSFGFAEWSPNLRLCQPGRYRPHVTLGRLPMGSRLDPVALNGPRVHLRPLSLRGAYLLPGTQL
jgi:hypothetical protein